jgi:hypothetical protein
MSWLLRERGVLVDQVDLQVADIAAAAQVVLAHQAVEIHRRRGAGIALDSPSPRARVQLPAPHRPAAHWSAPACCPRAGRPRPGTRTCCRRAASSARPAAAPRAPRTAPPAKHGRRTAGSRAATAVAGVRNGDITAGTADAGRGGAPEPGLPRFADVVAATAACTAKPGVTISAISSDSSMPTEALIGIGRMYGPISPETKAIGSSAAMTVNVARMVGPPTSSTAAGSPRAALRPRAALHVAVDVLDHHDGVVDQDADREDQREQRHAIEGEAHRPARRTASAPASAPRRCRPRWPRASPARTAPAAPPRRSRRPASGSASCALSVAVRRSRA